MTRCRQCSGEMGDRIRAEYQRNPWSPDGERAGDVNIRVDLPEARGDRVCIRQILTHQSSPEECASLGRCSRGWVSPAQCLGCRAIRTGIGYPANHTERCREKIEQELEKEPEGASKVAQDR